MPTVVRASSILLLPLIASLGCTAPDAGPDDDDGVDVGDGSGDGDGSGGGDGGGDGGGGGGDGEPAELERCVGRDFTPPPTEPWQNALSEYLPLAGAPVHFAQDVIGKPGEPAVMRAQFAYGPVWADLEDERIAVFVDDCTGWRSLGEYTTDAAGEIEVVIDEALAVGQHELRAVALGDGTEAVTSLWVLPEGTHLVVTDLDGTLTTSDVELFEQLFDELLDGAYVPAAYGSAAELTHAHAERGHVVVYLTGRPYWLLDMTRAWLDGAGFAPGPVRAADTNLEVVPTDGGVGAYKRAWLEGLVDAGYELDLAYGNTSTDIFAYLSAGLAPDQTWIIGSHAGEEGTHAVHGDWAARTDEVASGPRVDQPF